MGTGSSENTGERDAGSSRPAGSTTLIAAGVALVAAITVAALVAANRDAPDLQEGSPEALVQEYVDAMIEGHEATAHEYLSADMQAECSVRDLRDGQERADDVRVSLRTVTIDGDEADVEVTIIEDSGSDLFGGDGYRYEETFTLSRAGDTWVISERPWPIFFCTN